MEMVQICEHLKVGWFIKISISFCIETKTHIHNTHRKHLKKENGQASTETATMKQINIFIQKGQQVLIFVQNIQKSAKMIKRARINRGFWQMMSMHCVELFTEVPTLTLSKSLSSRSELLAEVGSSAVSLLICLEYIIDRWLILTCCSFNTECPWNPYTPQDTYC